MIGLPGSWRVNSLNIAVSPRNTRSYGAAKFIDFEESRERCPAINGSSMARPGSVASLDQTRHDRVINIDFFVLYRNRVDERGGRSRNARRIWSISKWKSVERRRLPSAIKVFDCATDRVRLG